MPYSRPLLKYTLYLSLRETCPISPPTEFLSSTPGAENEFSLDDSHIRKNRKIALRVPLLFCCFQFEHNHAIHFFRLRLRQFQHQSSLDGAELDATPIAQQPRRMNRPRHRRQPQHRRSPIQHMNVNRPPSFRRHAPPPPPPRPPSH